MQLIHVIGCLGVIMHFHNTSNQKKKKKVKEKKKRFVLSHEVGSAVTSYRWYGQ